MLSIKPLNNNKETRQRLHRHLVAAKRHTCPCAGSVPSGSHELYRAVESLLKTASNVRTKGQKQPRLSTCESEGSSLVQLASILYAHYVCDRECREVETAIIHIHHTPVGEAFTT